MTCCPSHAVGWHYLVMGSEAADEVLTSVFGIRSAVRKDNSDPTSKLGFEKILRGMIGELFRVAQPHEQAALQKALHALDVNWAGMKPTEVTEALNDAGKVFGGVPKLLVQPVIETLTKQGVAMVTASKAASIGRYDLPIAASFNVVDDKVIKHAAESQAFYIRDEFGKRQAAFSTIARQVVARGLEDGLDKHAIGKDLAAAASAAMVNRSDSYWTMIASVFATRSRTWGVLSSFQEGGIERYEISATLDEVSCDVCRFMDGQTFEVASAVNAFQRVAESDDPEAVAKLQPFMHVGVSASGDKGLFFGSGDQRVAVARVTDSALGQKDALGTFSHAMGGKELEKNGLGSPPFHPSCLPPGTMISTPGGRRPIESIRLGDTVIGGLSGEPRTVVEVHVNPCVGGVVVVRARGAELRLTRNHPVLTQRGWIEAGSLQVTDKVFRDLSEVRVASADPLAGPSEHGPSKRATEIDSISFEPFDDTVYNIGVDVDESYVAEGVVVHNCRCLTVASFE